MDAFETIGAATTSLQEFSDKWQTNDQDRRRTSDVSFEESLRHVASSCRNLLRSVITGDADALVVGARNLDEAFRQITSVKFGLDQLLALRDERAQFVLGALQLVGQSFLEKFCVLIADSTWTSYQNSILVDAAPPTSSSSLHIAVNSFHTRCSLKM
jgi:hypothetical protein